MGGRREAAIVVLIRGMMAWNDEELGEVKLFTLGWCCCGVTRAAW